VRSEDILLCGDVNAHPDREWTDNPYDKEDRSEHPLDLSEDAQLGNLCAGA
jgi:hypothetical protein